MSRRHKPPSRKPGTPVANAIRLPTAWAGSSEAQGLSSGAFRLAVSTWAFLDARPEMDGRMSADDLVRLYPGVIDEPLAELLAAGLLVFEGGRYRLAERIRS